MRRRFRRLCAFAFVSAAIACSAPEYSFAPVPGPDAGRDANAPKDSAADTSAPSPCGDAATFVDDHCYFFTPSEVLCREPCGGNATLAVFEKEAELLDVTDAMGRPPRGSRYYIGLVAKDGIASDAASSFRWVNDASLDYSHWNPGQPSGDKGATCVVQDVLVDAAVGPSPAWFDHQMDDPKFGLCERLP